MARLFRRALLAAGALGLTLVAGELLARRWYPLHGRIYSLDPERLHVAIPGSRRLQVMRGDGGDTRILVQLNSDGFRGPELRSAEARVLVAGDSMVLASNVRQPQTFVARLEAKLGELGRDWEAVNAGLESYGPDQTLLQLEELLPELRPDLVVLVLCAHNDFGDLHRNKLFGLDPQGELLRQEVILGERLTALFARREAISSKPVLLHLLQDWRARRSLQPVPESVDHVVECLTAARYQYEDAILRRSPIVEDVHRDFWDADVALHPNWPSSVHKRELMGAVLKAIAELCAHREVPLVALVVPSAMDIDPSFRLGPSPQRYPSHDPWELSNALLECAQGAGITTLDLTPLMVSSEPSRLFANDDDFHWNARAQSLAATACAEFLQGQGLLP